MIDSTAARQTMLSKVRGLNLDGVDSESISLEYAAVPRSYQRSGLLNAEQRVDLLEERLVEYDAHVHRVTPSTLPRAIAEAVNRRGAQRIAIPDGILANWITPAISVVEAESLSNVELDTFDGLLSGCTVAIALTGTIVLQHAPAQGPRKLSLIPDSSLRSLCRAGG